MSKIGKKPIKLPEGVSVEVETSKVTVTGPAGTLAKELPAGFSATVKDGWLTVAAKQGPSLAPALHGTTRAILANMVTGVSVGWKKVLELVGAGYKVETDGHKLTLNIGFSHPVKIKAPEGIAFKVEKTLITIEGRDKEVVGRLAAEIRAIKPPEPYKGKGIKYLDEVVRRKAGKAAKTAGPV